MSEHLGDGAQCPFAAQAVAFDPFDAPYQLDPAEALRWSRDNLPVFYSPKLGYWVVSRYEDIKAVFRDNKVFSPRNVLEKITPVGQEPLDILASYGFAFNRTLVNEDEPAHMNRRRVLMDHFLPENLEAHKDMVRQLTKERLDAIIESGRADLVEALLWEVPLTVALHFLGVPKDDMAKLREFSVAHTVNTWGRPTPDEQIQVAHDVGRFWQYAGDVLTRMRAEPDGTGWMHDAIRKNAEMPDIVTDSYLHSMMMAIIVAAHETTSHASANMFKTLLSHPDVWSEICEEPALIPHAVEECLRFSGSVVAWRRETTQNTELGGVAVPAGAKILMVTASGNHDGRYFENGDQFDIHRENAVDHLTFGYGSHQCMGKNLARIEMRIFLEEFTRRLPHMKLSDQAFSYLPNTSFRGPDALWVEWDPSKNPEKIGAVNVAQIRDFHIGAPNPKDISLEVQIVEIKSETDDIKRIVLGPLKGRVLPPWTAGAHIEVTIGGFSRKYSLCGLRTDSTYQLAVLNEKNGRGGSSYIHNTLRVGDQVSIHRPTNHFRLDETAQSYVLVAGGIGITPILTMADRLKSLAKPYVIHYFGRSRSEMAFVERLEQDHKAHLNFHFMSGRKENVIRDICGDINVRSQLYVCGPERLLAAFEAHSPHLPPGALHTEHFAPVDTVLDPRKEKGFNVTLLDSGFSLNVAPDQTLLEALHAAGVDVASDCCEGLCGSCEVIVEDGDVDHRDRVLTAVERAENTRMMACCSRSRDGSDVKLRL